MDEPLRILVVESRFYDGISDALLEGASQALKAFGAEFDVVTVPGAFELPAAIAFAEEAGHGASGLRYDGYVALGCVIRGETTHYDYVCGESARGLMDLSVRSKLAIGYGIVTVNTMEQAKARAETHRGDKGGDAAHACLAMVALQRRWRNQ